jgi:outer membrane protein assembly factor BamA
VFDPFFFGDFGARKESTFSPNYVYNTVDNPYTPRRGMKHTLTFAVAGGPLRGTVDYLRPNVEFIFYVPHTRRTALGLRFDGAIIKPYSDTRTLPLYQRYFLGGETQVRGYEIRSIGPVDSSGRAIGGNKYFLFNAEYYIDIMGPLRWTSACPRERRSASSCPCSTSPSASSTPSTRTGIPCKPTYRVRPSSSRSAPPSKEKKKT